MHSKVLTSSRLQELGSIVRRIKACTEMAKRLTRMMTWQEQRDMDDQLQALANEVAILSNDLTVEGLRQWNELNATERSRKKQGVGR